MHADGCTTEPAWLPYQITRWSIPPLRRHSDAHCHTVASLRLVSPGAVTDGVTLFLLAEKMMTFLVIVLKSDAPLPLSPAFHVIVCPVFL